MYEYKLGIQCVKYEVKLWTYFYGVPFFLTACGGGQIFVDPSWGRGPNIWHPLRLLASPPPSPHPVINEWSDWPSSSAMKDHLSHKTTLCVSIKWSLIAGFIVVVSGASWQSKASQHAAANTNSCEWCRWQSKASQHAASKTNSCQWCIMTK